MTIALRALADDARDRAELQRVLGSAPGYAHRVTGLPVGPADAQSTFGALPPGKHYDDKVVFAIERDGAMVGCIDVIRGWPDAESAMLGLLLVDERLHRQGIGAAAYARLEDFVATSWQEIARMRIGIVDANREVALPFWSRLGFVANGETKPHRNGTVESTVRVYLKRLRARSPARDPELTGRAPR